ncbi:MAG: hypothetical protein ABIH36_03935 [bacterium]
MDKKLSLGMVAFLLILFWQEKRVADGVKLVVYTAAWLALFVVSVMVIMIIR